MHNEENNRYNGYHKYIAHRGGWVDEKTAKDCFNWAATMFPKNSYLKDWYRIRFCDKVHFNYDIQNKLRTIWKANIRYCQKCIEEIHEISKEK